MVTCVPGAWPEQAAAKVVMTCAWAAPAPRYSAAPKAAAIRPDGRRLRSVALDKEQISPHFFAAEKKPAERNERDIAEKRSKLHPLMRGGGENSFLYSFWKYGSWGSDNELALAERNVCQALPKGNACCCAQAANRHGAETRSLWPALGQPRRVPAETTQNNSWQRLLDKDFGY